MARRAEQARQTDHKSGPLGGRFFLPDRLGTKYRLRIRPNRTIVLSSMKNLFTITVTALALAAFATTSFAGSCGSCPGEGGDKAKDKDKTEEGSAS